MFQMPLYNSAALYTKLVPCKNNPKMLVGSGYNGEKELCFYLSDEIACQIEENETGSIVFPNFPEAYKFILENNICVLNIECGSYKDEIKRYKCEQKKKGDICLKIN